LSKLPPIFFVLVAIAWSAIWAWPLVSYLFDFVISFHRHLSPSRTFLNTIVSVEAVVIAITLPVSLDVVARMSDRYKSEVLVRTFLESWLVRVLPIAVILNIILIVLVEFLLDDKYTGFWWSFMSWLVLYMFLAVAVSLVIFFYRIIKYITDEDYVVDKLFHEAEKILNG